MVGQSLLHCVASLLAFACAPSVALVEGAWRNQLHGHWEGHLEHKERLFAIRLNVTDEGPTMRATLDLPEYCIYGSSAKLSIRGDTVTIATDDITVQAKLTEDVLTGKSQGFRDIRANVLLERETVDPVRYRHEELEFESESARLAGTLVFPAGAGPFPLVVWTHGSGPDTRSTFYYSGRAHLFAQAGIASLIYDKRGSGKSTGDASWKLDNLVVDAVAAVGAVATHRDVDPDAIGIAGFSQGGWVAPIAATLEDAIDFILVGATPGISVGEQNIYSATSRLRRDGLSAADVAAAQDFLTRLYAFYETGEGREEVLRMISEAENSAWYVSRWVANVTFISKSGLIQGKHPSWDPSLPDVSSIWSKVSVPVLSIWGANDVDVPPEESKRAIEAALRSASNTDFELRIFPDASHGFWQSDGSEEWDWPRQAPGCHQLLVDWTLDHVGER